MMIIIVYKTRNLQFLYRGIIKYLSYDSTINLLSPSGRGVVDRESQGRMMDQSSHIINYPD